MRNQVGCIWSQSCTIKERSPLPTDFVETVPLPVPAAGAVRFVHQAQFHPLKFISSIAERLTARLLERRAQSLWRRQVPFRK